MKTRITMIITALCAAFLGSAYAGPPGIPGWPDGFPARVSSEKQAMGCSKQGATVALVCKDCKTINAKTEKKGIAGWFKADSTHGCSGCGGKIMVKTGATKGGPAAEYHHTCSKCGDKAAYICATHK